VPELAATTEKLVPAHPLVVGAAKVAIVKPGSTRSMVSDTESGALREKVNEMDDFADASGWVSTKSLNVKAGAATAVDTAIGVAEMSVTPASTAAIVRVFRFAACVTALVVTPVAIVTVHCVAAASVAPPVVNVNVAVAVPELLAAAVKFVLAHPLVAGTDIEAMEKVGSARTTLSATARGTFRANASTREVSAAVMGFMMSTWLWDTVGTGATTAVD
jgi:hypothetical protein